MKDKLVIVCTCRMGPGTFDAKMIPLSMVDRVGKIIVVRKEQGPEIPKLNYYLLPRLCNISILNILLTPFIIARQTKKQKADVILAYHYVPHYYFAFFASRLTGIPYILGQTGSDDQKLVLHPIRGLLLRKAIRSALCLNVPGQESVKFWHSQGFRKVNILHSTIDTDYFVPSDNTKTIDFVYIGRLESYKGVHVIISAMKEVIDRYPAANLAIVGYGSQQKQLKHITLRLDLSANVTFHEYQKNVRDWLHRSRIFVMASDTEGLPCSLMEAMSCGIVCITSWVGNIRDIIQDGITGFGFDKQNKEVLARLMIDTYEREQMLTELKIQARDIIVREHSYQTAIDIWNKIIDELVNQ